MSNRSAEHFNNEIGREDASEGKLEANMTNIDPIRGTEDCIGVEGDEDRPMTYGDVQN